MNDGSVDKDRAIFERSYMAMQQHLKPLYMRDKVNGVGIKKVLIDYAACANIMPQSLLGKIGKSPTGLACNNMVLSNYEGKTSKPLGVIQVDVVPTLFVVVPTKSNYNLLLGREWLHGLRCVPSSMHQRITI